MSRINKYRGYDKVNKRMFEVYGLGVDWCTEDTMDGVNENHNYWDGDSFKNNIEIMQFTGLKDKNGVDIYEGDICTKMISPDEDQLAPKELHRGEIVYHVGGFCYKSGGYYYPMSRTHGVINVIGNIYENPELLTN